MIKISSPVITTSEKRATMTALIEDEYQKIKTEIYYSTPIEYGKYLCDDVADAFVVGVLLPAARYEQDIVVDGAVSDKLFYNINNSIFRSGFISIKS